VFEDDVRQEIRSIRRVPVSVLLLLDTAGELNPAMSVRTTREIATHLISNLRAGDHMAAFQFGGRLELIQDWTTKREDATLAIKAKLFSGKRSRLTDALLAAATKMKEVPSGTRHLVLITDGVAAAADDGSLAAAIEQVLNSNITVHVISYTAIGRKAIQKRNPLVKITTEKRRTAKDIADEIMNPTQPSEQQKKNKLYLVIDTDIAMRRRRAQYKEATQESEQWLSSLAEETGGIMLLPESVDEMIKRSEEVTREIDSQYVVAYTPKRPLALATAEEYRRLKVASGRGGLQVHARRGYVAKPQ
jgi:VWFA-related protein